MNIDRYINFDKMLGVSGLFAAIGSFGVIDGDAHYNVSEEGNVLTYMYSNGKVELCATFNEYSDGVIIRRDSFKNLGYVTLNG